MIHIETIILGAFKGYTSRTDNGPFMIAEGVGLFGGDIQWSEYRWEHTPDWDIVGSSKSEPLTHLLKTWKWLQKQ